MGKIRARFSGAFGGLGTQVLAIVLCGCVIAGASLAMIGPKVAARTISAPRPLARPMARPLARPMARPAPAHVPPVVVATAPVPLPAPAAPAQGYIVKRVLQIAGPMRQGDHYWDERGAPVDGAMVVTVDLAAQTVSVFRAGYEIGTAVMIYGDDSTPTPLGIFPITQKDADHVSNLYGAPMPYMLRLTNDGISIHGSDVGNGYVTHGCIGVPTAFAKKIFGAVKLGDTVIITRGERLAIGQAITAA